MMLEVARQQLISYAETHHPASNNNHIAYVSTHLNIG